MQTGGVAFTLTIDCGGGGIKGSVLDEAGTMRAQPLRVPTPYPLPPELFVKTLVQHGVPHSVIVDNVGGHLMQHGRVDLCIVGSDRTTATGDVANKIGTYLKALAADDNGIPFYVALPSSTIDWTLRDGVREIPIEEREGGEVTHIAGRLADGSVGRVQVTPDGSPAANFAFDVTPSRLVTGLITERGVCPASEKGLLSLFPERRRRLAGE